MSEPVGAFGSIVFASASHLERWLSDHTRAADGAVLDALGEALPGAVVRALFPGKATGDELYALTTRGKRATIHLAMTESSLDEGALAALAGVAAAARHEGTGRLVLFVDDEVTHALTLEDGEATLRAGDGASVRDEAGFEAFVRAVAVGLSATKPRAAAKAQPTARRSASSEAAPSRESAVDPKAATTTPASTPGAAVPPKAVAESPTLKALERAVTWSPALLAAAFAEHRAATVDRLADLVERRDVLAKGVAYKTLGTLLDELVAHPTRAIGALAPTLERIVEFPTWDPDGMRQFEFVRTRAMRLLARAKRPAASTALRRFLSDFPERVDREMGSGYLFALAEIALDLGDRTMAPLFAPLLERMLPDHGRRQRESALAPTRQLVDKLARKK